MLLLVNSYFGHRGTIETEAEEIKVSDETPAAVEKTEETTPTALFQWLRAGGSDSPTKASAKHSNRGKAFGFNADAQFDGGPARSIHPRSPQCPNGSIGERYSEEPRYRGQTSLQVWTKV